MSNRSAHRVTRYVLIIFFLLILPAWDAAAHGSPGAAAKNLQEMRSSARRFVQEFYDWYVPTALKDNTIPAWDLALEHKKSLFSRGLFQALEADSDAQARAEGELVGLDFDPFLNSQDPAERYEVGKITRKGDRFGADVYAVRSGKKGAKPDVVPELEHKNGHWLFVNFRYPKKKNRENGDLLTILRLLREDRQEHRE